MRCGCDAAPHGRHPVGRDPATVAKAVVAAAFDKQIRKLNQLAG
jgi:hypothetical protein